MAKFKKFRVEIGTNGHIKLNGEVIAVLGSWNRYEDCEYCDKSGIISRAEYPGGIDRGVHHYSYACKCSSGTVMKSFIRKGGLPYFDHFDYFSDDNILVKNNNIGRK